MLFSGTNTLISFSPATHLNIFKNPTRAGMGFLKCMIFKSRKENNKRKPRCRVKHSSENASEDALGERHRSVIPAMDDVRAHEHCSDTWEPSTASRPAPATASPGHHSLPAGNWPRWLLGFPRAKSSPRLPPATGQRPRGPPSPGDTQTHTHIHTPPGMRPGTSSLTRGWGSKTRRSLFKTSGCHSWHPTGREEKKKVKKKKGNRCQPL